MIRKIVKIDEEKCTGCGLCASACHENAIVMENGKAHLLRDDYCDGLGDCLPACPADAITIEERESAAYDPQAVEMRKQILAQQTSGGCPGSAMHTFNRAQTSESENESSTVRSELMQWPVQIKLLPVQAAFYENANLLIAADCTAYAYAAFHRDFIKNHITLVGCPKLDEGDYTDKLTAIISQNNIKSITIVRMEVPCCGGLEYAATEALKASGKFIPWRVVVISRNGEILE
ncbi:4Fe-4S binding domain-containing protein [Treponema sp. JC4]|uniref:ATP-binding protein n=1 Tax=Treponema sp. JC4 TaxID=1124982 RepID=UPI00025AFBDE|nr:4Fe-4S binding protein [Treponema sp. JC4]EID85098.1 4Fe-4S binding domain-containing protein [Treponema sp. JC4]